MAGAVRQPIDVGSLSKYIERNVPEIELPIIVKQVFIPSFIPLFLILATAGFPPPYDMIGSRSLTYTNCLVFLWTVKSDISTHRRIWHQVCATQEAAREAALENRASGEAGVSDHSCAPGKRCACAQGLHLV